MTTRQRAGWAVPLLGSALCSTASVVWAQGAVTPAPAAAVPAPAGTASEQKLIELRNTVVNLLQALVERGVLTKEQASEMVKSAQEKAATESAALAQQQKAEEGAIRVPYVPQIVKDEIRNEVVAEIAPTVRQDVAEEVGSKGTVFSALPSWMQRMTWTGDIRLRGEGDIFDKNNATNYYYDYNQINSKGGITAAGSLAYLNTTQDQDRLRVRARFGFDADLGSGFTTGVRLATGTTGEVVATTNQTLGSYGAAYQVSFDQAYLRWLGSFSDGAQLLTATGGRFENPWVSSDLVWYNDLTFEGLVSNYRFNLSDDNSHRHDLFVTVGALPIESYSLFDPNPEGQQKWLLAGQLGADWTTDEESRFRLAAAYYDYIHIVGQRNPLNSPSNGSPFNWTAPTFVQKGNTMFPIGNSTDPNVGLWALASNFRIVDVIATGDIRVYPGYSLTYTAEGLRNVGFNTADVMARYGSYVAPRTKGYRADVGFGTSTFSSLGAWRASVGYRYLQRDATLDAFNDEDFHLGGTDAKGYTLLFDLAFNPHVWLRAKYMSANSIDGPPLGIDVWQIDLNGRF
jgi:hypothetical protein